jgi:hypothetical protein
MGGGGNGTWIDNATWDLSPVIKVLARYLRDRWWFRITVSSVPNSLRSNNGRLRLYKEESTTLVAQTIAEIDVFDILGAV